MEQNSFLNGIISSALAAQDQQESANREEYTSEGFSGITEKDGYVGEMVKASLSIFEAAKTPKDYRKPFAPDQIAVIDSIKVTVSETSLPADVTMESFDSISELVQLISNAAEIDLDLDKLDIYFGSDNKVHMEQPSEYGPIRIEVGVSAYEEVETNKVLNLQRK